MNRLKAQPGRVILPVLFGKGVKLCDRVFFFSHIFIVSRRSIQHYGKNVLKSLFAANLLFFKRYLLFQRTDMKKFFLERENAKEKSSLLE